MPSHITFDRVDAVIGAEVYGLGLDQVPNEKSIAVLEQALEKYGVLIFRKQEVTPRQLVEFSRPFAPLALAPREEDRHKDHPEIFVIGNPEGKQVVFAPDVTNSEIDDMELEWHTDHSQYSIPARATILLGEEVPAKGGDTAFACTYTAYDALSAAEKRQYENVTLLHSVRGLNDYLRRLNKLETLNSHELDLEKEPPQKWPLVRRHPLSGRRALYFGSHMSIGVDGLPEAEGRALIKKVTAHATRPEFQYRHRWQKGDVLFWDNRRLIHAATPYDTTIHRRVIYRTTLEEVAPVVM
ncbi:TauD/TfdA dioxygenase family protein [Pelagibius marinus]|uniref:TauD/TfdA dioxygenase family protein n=1 Tax=Pelagibius marinus TaxID=2762760 RepID=UPI0018731FBB|nr:TauD/TfdA family dioxygenase [Pelagibius marinus]